jgi:hypothetical protein
MPKNRGEIPTKKLFACGCRQIMPILAASRDDPRGDAGDLFQLHHVPRHELEGVSDYQRPLTDMFR